MPYKDPADMAAFVNRRHRRLKEDAVTYKGGTCLECDFRGHPACFDFHHRDPSQKDCQWTHLKKRSWERIKEELDKCDLLCANCHRVKHATALESDGGG